MKTIKHLESITVKGYPFVNHVKQVETEATFNLLNIFDHKGYHGSQHNAMNFGSIKIMGYLYDIKRYLKKYIIKTEHYGILEYYAPNKTTLRKILSSSGFGYIYYIKEI
jgi:hypothetical protein